MNIDRKKYKGLSFFEDGGRLKVDAQNGMLMRWMKDSITDVGEGANVTHEYMMNVVLSSYQKSMKGNIMYISEPVMKMSRENYQKMIDVVRYEWLKDQNGAVLLPDGSIITFITRMVPDEEREMFEQEQCIGNAVFTLISPKGELEACALCASRLEYEGDGERKLMYDSSIPTMLASEIFSPIICVLAFMQYADTEKVYIENGQKSKQRETMLVNSSGVRIKYVDSRYIREIIRTEGFKVSGHFRMQPYKKDGEWTKKLIYISAFEKHGYHRKALRDKEE